MKLVAVDHAQITIPKGSADAARSFYCGVLGFAEIDKPTALQGRGGFWLELDGFQVHVGTEDGVDRKATKAHIAYRVDDLEGWRQKLENEDVEIFEGVQIPHFRRFEFRDPFGNRVEFLERVQ
jgi:catechol 2,3-dioxygenase-like lactoylglutathione lyase family enzyme